MVCLFLLETFKWIKPKRYKQHTTAVNPTYSVKIFLRLCTSQKTGVSFLSKKVSLFRTVEVIGNKNVFIILFTTVLFYIKQCATGQWRSSILFTINYKCVFLPVSRGPVCVDFRPRVAHVWVVGAVADVWAVDDGRRCGRWRRQVVGSRRRRRHCARAVRWGRNRWRIWRTVHAEKKC